MEPGNVTSDSEHVQSYIIDHGNQVPPQSGDWTAMVQDLRFVQSGKYICGHVDSSQNLVQLLESYRSITGTAFTSSQNLVNAIKPIDQGQLQMRFVSPASRPRLFWQMSAGEPTISYDGVPFMSVGHGTDLPCVRFGGRRKKVEQVSLPSGEVMPVDYRMRTGCEAKITIRRVLRYPCAEYESSVSQGIAAVRRQRKQILEDLVQRIIAGSAKFQERYHFVLPTPMAHNGHAVSDIDTPPPLSRQVADEILTLLNNKVTSVSLLRDHVKSLVVAGGGGATGSSSLVDPLYLPSEFDIFRQVYWLFKMDQVVVGEQQDSASFKGILQAVTQTQSIVTPSPAMENGSNAASGNSIIPTSSSSTSASADAITSVYSIIMDDTTTGDGASSLDHLGGDHHHLSAQQEVELSSTPSDKSVASAAHLGMMGAESPPSMANQLQVGGGGGGMGAVPTTTTSPSPSSAPPSIPQAVSIQPGGVGVTVGGAGGGATQARHVTATKRSLLQNSSSVVVVPPVKASAGGGGAGGSGSSRPLTTSISTHRNTSSTDLSPLSPPEDDSVSQAQAEVQSIMRIIENQSHACKSLSALNNLRRQLTELCGQFSVHLARGSSPDFGTPSAKRART